MSEFATDLSGFSDTPLAIALGQLQIALGAAMRACDAAQAQSDDPAVTRILRRRQAALAKGLHETDLLVAALVSRASSS